MADGILLFGSPGVGKGDLSKVLKSYDFEYLGSGDIFREIARRATEGDEVAAQIYSTMNSGKLIDDETTMSEFRRHLENVPVEKSFIFDAPRSAEQVRIFSGEIAPERKLKRKITLYLEASRKVCSDRLFHRGANSGRTDDVDPKIVEERLNEFDGYKAATLAALRNHSDHFFTIPAHLKRQEVATLALVRLCTINPSDGFREAMEAIDFVQEAAA